MGFDRLLQYVNWAHINMGIDMMWIFGRETLEELAAANNFHLTIKIITELPYGKHVLLLDTTSHLERDRVYNIVDPEAAIHSTAARISLTVRARLKPDPTNDEQAMSQGQLSILIK